MKALLPAVFIGLLTFWSGAFAGGATFSGAVSAHAACLAFCLLAGARWSDPLGLGARGRWLVPVVLAVVGVSWWFSPVPRAGVVGLLLLPAFLLIPSAVVDCWRDPRDRRRGLEAVGLLLGLVSVVALVLFAVQGSPRAAMPLGHHNLLAAWLVILWPIGFVALGFRARRRLLLIVAASLSIAALAATGSFLAFCAFLVQALIAAVWWKRARVWLAVAVLSTWLAPVVVQRVPAMVQMGTPASERGESVGISARHLERASRVISRTDTSTRARLVYAEAGWNGFRERPVLGWGPGSVPWTNALFMNPAEGVNPPGEVVGDLHSLPVQLAYEMGLIGFAVVALMVLFFVRRRVAEMSDSDDVPVLQAALVGLAGGAVMLLGNAPVTVLALLAAIAVVLGAALSPSRSIASSLSRSTSKSVLSILCLYALPAAVLLLPFERAHYFYERATQATDSSQALWLVRRAAGIDPDFPLYRARAAWLAAEVESTGKILERHAQSALRAARDGRGLAPLWLAAGTLGLEAGQPWAMEALDQARQLDPLSPLPRFHLLRAGPDGTEAEELGESAVRGDSRLGAAVFWDRYPELREGIVERLGRESPEALALMSTGIDGPSALLAQSLDLVPSRSFSLFAFRRSPWPADFAEVEVWTDRLPGR